MRPFRRQDRATAGSEFQQAGIDQVLAAAAAELRELREAAEKAALGIEAALAGQPDAPPDARKLDRARLVAELVGSLRKRATELAREAAELERVLERASRSLGSSSGEAITADEAGREEGMRVFAAHLARSGTPAEVIENELRTRFGARNAPELVARALADQAEEQR